MRTKKGQNTTKDEAAENELRELSEEEMKQVSGGLYDRNYADNYTKCYTKCYTDPLSIPDLDNPAS